MKVKQSIKGFLLGIVCCGVGFFIMPEAVALTLFGIFWAVIGINKIAEGVLGQPIIAFRRAPNGQAPDSM